MAFSPRILNLRARMTLRNVAAARDFGMAALERFENAQSERGQMCFCAVCYLPFVTCRCKHLDLPYGARGPEVPAKKRHDLCPDCYEPVYIWLGNLWSITHKNRTASGCSCRCHEGEIWMA